MHKTVTQSNHSDPFKKKRIIVQHVLSKTFTTEKNIKISSNDETHNYFFDKYLLT